MNKHEQTAQDLKAIVRAAYEAHEESWDGAVYTIGWDIVFKAACEVYGYSDEYAALLYLANTRGCDLREWANA